MQPCIAARHGTTLAQNGCNMPRADEQPPRTDSLARTIPPQYGERGQALDDGQQRAERSRKPMGNSVSANSRAAIYEHGMRTSTIDSALCMNERYDFWQAQK